MAFGFGKKKREQEAEAARLANEAQVKQISEKSFQAGLNGSSWVFEQAWKNASWTVAYLKLQEGAVQALAEGRPDNFRFMLFRRNELGLKTSDVLLQLTKGKDSASAINLISRAFEGLPDHDKQVVLDEALVNLLKSTSATTQNFNCRSFTESDQTFLDVLLQAGANGNADAGRAFAYAVARHSPATVKLLRNHGAEYSDAQLIMQIERWKDDYYLQGCIEKLRSYQEHENTDLRGQLQQNLRDITERLEIVEQRISKLESEAPRKILRANDAPKL